MHDPAIERVVDELLIDSEWSGERSELVSMLHYLGRSSLPILRIDRDGVEAAIVCGEVDQYRIGVTQLLHLWQGLRAGRPIDWQTLDRVG